MENSIIPTGSELAIMPVMNVKMALERRAQITDFIRQVMKRDIDYGVIPGTGDKPTLLKAGAEKLTTLFGLSKKFTLLEKLEDWSGLEHGGEPFFYYIYRCGLYRGDLLIAEADGSCNSHESKYRYRKGERTCPNCGQTAIIKGRAEYGGGWVCYTKRGGCGAKFQVGDSTIESQEVGRILNPDVADQANTILKMSQKRALVAATLLAINGSEYFSTKEIPGLNEDDQIIEGEATPLDNESNDKQESSTPPAKPNGGNGHTAKPYRFPSNAAESFWNLVQKATDNFYDNPEHLKKTIGGWFKFDSQDLWDTKLSEAVDHARIKRQASQVEVEGQVTQEQIP